RSEDPCWRTRSDVSMASVVARAGHVHAEYPVRGTPASASDAYTSGERCAASSALLTTAPAEHRRAHSFHDLGTDYLQYFFTCASIAGWYFGKIPRIVAAVFGSTDPPACMLI